MGEIQSVLLSRKRYKTVKDAEKWIRMNNFKNIKVDITKNYYRFRQHPPYKYNKFRAKRINDNLIVILGFK